jgi:hypothetical protein
MHVELERIRKEASEGGMYMKILSRNLPRLAEVHLANPER